jgi:predicted N-acyltransferase
MRLTVHEAIADIAPDAWNALAGDTYPFLRHEFLLAAEQTGCVSEDAGWAPRHLTLERNGQLVAAMPLYQKEHSWGEFVFDWAWARAYEQAGLRYYPKLVSAVPFTPAPSRRLLLADPGDTAAARALVDGAIELAERTACSSVHVLFPTHEELPLLRDAGLQVRKDCQFHWHNRDYADFDQFLQTFTASKRKKARRDRRRVSEAGIRFRRLKGAEIDTETWELVYRFVSITFMRRGSLPYYNLDFFLRIGETLPDNILVILAEQDAEPIAAAVFFESPTALYGRYWGSDGHHNALHFETCYYQGIDYCIDKGLQLFEPGTQGEHKISRGFAPQSTWSAHWLAHPQFLSAIENYLEEEARYVDRYIETVDARSPYRDDGSGDES